MIRILHLPSTQASVSPCLSLLYNGIILGTAVSVNILDLTKASSLNLLEKNIFDLEHLGKVKAFKMDYENQSVLYEL
jgi:hypothetical protein